jgi:hypothetical protein
MALGTPVAFANQAGQGTGTLGDAFGNTLYVDTVNGNDNNSGTLPNKALATMAEALTRIQSNGTIYASGHIIEQCAVPADVFGVRIAGLVNGNPRHTTDGGVVLDGNGVDWTVPASPTANEPLLRISEQGWVVENICFIPTDGEPAIELRRDETAALFDASHSVIRGCRFIAGAVTGTIGIEDIGGTSQVTVENCIFDTLASGIVNTSTAIANPNRWVVQGCKFENNTEHIDMPFTQSYFMNNIMDEATVNIDFAGGAGGNFVLFNQFSNTEADITISDGYTPGTNDVWRNYSTNTAAFTVGVPS